MVRALTDLRIHIPGEPAEATAAIADPGRGPQVPLSATHDIVGARACHLRNRKQIAYLRPCLRWSESWPPADHTLLGGPAGADQICRVGRVYHPAAFSPFHQEPAFPSRAVIQLRCASICGPACGWPHRGASALHTIARVRPSEPDRAGEDLLVADVTSRFQQLRDRYGWLDHLVRAAARYTERHGNDYGAAVTYFSVLSLVPITMIAFAAAGFVLGARPGAVDQCQGDEWFRLVSGACSSRSR